MIIHDGRQGFGFWTPAEDSEIYGSIIYNVGAEDPQRGHGHSIYTQNAAGVKRIADTVMFNGMSFGVHAYTEGGRVDNFVLEGNVSFNHGLPSTSGAKANYLFGGGDVSDNVTFIGSFSYYSPLAGRGADMDYGAGCANPAIRNNYLVGATAINVSRCTNVTMTGNTLFSSGGSLATQFPNNTYIAGTTSPSAVARKRICEH
jgi:hypothetical protein